jgi:O-acetyl-ADP-ribose deacetylase (regulator of RNase III)
MEVKVGRSRLVLIRGDITDQETEAIVNAANPGLMGGGGVDGAIHRRGGPAILAECRAIRSSRWPRGLPTGEAVITCGGNLKAHYVIHTVGPIYKGGGGEAELLARAYCSSLRLALEKGIRTIAFPSISTGAYGYPIDEAAKVALRAVMEFLRENDGLEEVRFVLFSERDLQIYLQAMTRIDRPIDGQ